MKFIILDENEQELERSDFLRDYDFSYVNKIEDVPNIDEAIKNFLNNLDYGVFVYSYIEDMDDFTICFLNNKARAAHFSNLSSKRPDFLYNMVSSFDKKSVILKYMKKVYKTSKVQKLIFKCYADDFLVKDVLVKIMKVNDFICILGEDRTDVFFLTKEEENLFNNNVTGVAILQDNKYIRCNNKYLKIFKQDLSDVIGKEIGYSGFVDASRDCLIDINNKVLEKRLVSYLVTPFKIIIDEELFYFDLNYNFIIYKGKPAIMIIFKDITEKELNKIEVEAKRNEALDLQGNLKEIQRISKISMSYMDNKGNIDWSKSSFDIFKIDLNKYKNYHNKLSDIVLDVDLDHLIKTYEKCSASHPEETCVYRVKTGEGEILNIHAYIICNCDEDGNKLGYFTFYQDVTKEIKYQNQLTAALNDKEILLSEVHHRVKNNLQIILSLINLNKNYQKDSELILDDTETRIYAMALIHEKIYDSISLADVNMKDYVNSLVNSLFNTYFSNINYHDDVDPINLDMDYSIPLGLIINELVTNTIKHAFPKYEEGNLYIKFTKKDNHYILIIKDDGIGLPDDLDLNDLSSLGLIVVQNLTLQIGGTFNIIESEGSGFRIEFDEE